MNYILGVIIFVLAAVGAGQECHFKTDKGEEIPVNVVKILVKAEYEKLTLGEVALLRKYFPIPVHSCMSQNCTLRGQVRFHGTEEEYKHWVSELIK